MAYQYPIISPAGVEIGSYTDDNPNLSREEVLQKFQAQQQQGFQTTGGTPGAPSMQQPEGTPLSRLGGYLKENVVSPVAEIARGAGSYMTPLSPALGEPAPKEPGEATINPSLGTLAEVGGAALFPAAAVGGLIGGAVGATSGVPGAQTVGEILGGLGFDVASGKYLGTKTFKDMLKGLFKNKQQQIEKFTAESLQTPAALKEDVGGFVKGFKDQPITFKAQIKEPMANDVDSLYEIARNTKTPVQTDEVRKLAFDVKNAQGKLSPKGVAEAMNDFLADVPPGKVPYNEVFKKTEELEKRAKELEAAKDTSAAHDIRAVKNSIIDALDKYSKVGRTANSLNRQDKMAIGIIQKLRSGRIDEVENMLISDRSIAARFGWNTEAKLDQAINQLKQIRKTPSQASAMLALQRLGGSGLLAYALHRGIFDFVFSGHGR